MPERYRTLTVALSQDTSDEGIEHLKTVLGSIKGIDSVLAGESVGSQDYMARQAALRQFAMMLTQLACIAGLYGDDGTYEQVADLLRQSWRKRTGSPPPW